MIDDAREWKKTDNSTEGRGRGGWRGGGGVLINCSMLFVDFVIRFRFLTRVVVVISVPLTSGQSYSV